MKYVRIIFCTSKGVEIYPRMQKKMYMFMFPTVGKYLRILFLCK
jgi:hypothetical protein